ncbi:Protein FAR1-RELATED SEQUENCE 3 [Bienertia sinuspersici]
MNDEIPSTSIGSLEASSLATMHQTPTMTFTPRLCLTPKGSKEWIPCCPLELKPVVEMLFDTLADGIQFYIQYARFCGFVRRHGPEKKDDDGNVLLKYVYCNKEGYNDNEVDAAMFINNLKEKVKNSVGGFFFDYCVNEKGNLTRVFWADAISRRNYSVFGDMLSFNTTYDTNTYSMVFAPFTGLDHHGKCVTFGVGLLANEHVESFTWLFQCFLKGMGGFEPTSLMTDQDPAMKVAIDKANHPTCMPADLKLLEILGIFSVAMTRATNAATEDMTKAGMIPPPNNASHGPAPSNTVIYDQANTGLIYVPNAVSFVSPVYNQTPRGRGLGYQDKTTINSTMPKKIIVECNQQFSDQYSYLTGHEKELAADSYGMIPIAVKFHLQPTPL